MTEAVVYDTGMLIGLANRSSAVASFHSGVLRSHTPIVPGPVVAQVWRRGAATEFTLGMYLKDCEVVTDYDLDQYKRVGVILGQAALPPKKRPDVVDALVVMTAARYGSAAILTSDPEDLKAYAATLPKSRLLIRGI
ncbi:hypothetical protein [Kitasatospora sp. GAS1066B]|uniref:hypothetical protein n=1 Tax=Kitasatospora sp. GAS1066B TaxID=3156271 RepID=UPI0035172B36